MLQSDSPSTRYTGLHPRNVQLGAASRLAKGILLRAFLDVSSDKATQWREDAEDWFFSEEDGPGSLTWVCEILQLDPGALCTWLNRYHQSTLKDREEMTRRLLGSLRHQY